MLGDNFAKQLQSITLLNHTVARRIGVIPEDVQHQPMAIPVMYDVTINPAKCAFGKPEVKFLG